MDNAATPGALVADNLEWRPTICMVHMTVWVARLIAHVDVEVERRNIHERSEKAQSQQECNGAPGKASQP